MHLIVKSCKCMFVYMFNPIRNNVLATYTNTISNFNTHSCLEMSHIEVLQIKFIAYYVQQNLNCRHNGVYHWWIVHWEFGQIPCTKQVIIVHRSYNHYCWNQRLLFNVVFGYLNLLNVFICTIKSHTIFQTTKSTISRIYSTTQWNHIHLNQHKENISVSLITHNTRVCWERV